MKMTGITTETVESSLIPRLHSTAAILSSFPGSTPHNMVLTIPTAMSTLTSLPTVMVAVESIPGGL